MLNWLHERRTDGTPHRETRFAVILGSLFTFAIFAFFMPSGVLEHVTRAKGWL